MPRRLRSGTWRLPGGANLSATVRNPSFVTAPTVCGPVRGVFHAVMAFGWGLPTSRSRGGLFSRDPTSVLSEAVNGYALFGRGAVYVLGAQGQTLDAGVARYSLSACRVAM